MFECVEMTSIGCLVLMVCICPVLAADQCMGTCRLLGVSLSVCVSKGIRVGCDNFDTVACVQRA